MGQPVLADVLAPELGCCSGAPRTPGNDFQVVDPLNPGRTITDIDTFRPGELVELKLATSAADVGFVRSVNEAVTGLNATTPGVNISVRWAP